MTDRPAPGSAAGSAAARPAAGLPLSLGGRGPWIAIPAAPLAARLGFVAIPPPPLPWADGEGYAQLGRPLVPEPTVRLHAPRGPGYPTLIPGGFAGFGPNLA